MKLVKLLVEVEEGWILQVQEDFLPNPEQEPDQKLFFAAGQDPEEGLAENILLCPDTSTWVFARFKDSLSRDVLTRVLELMIVATMNRLNR